MEVDILAEKAQNIQDRALASSPDIQQILSIVRNFIEDSKVLCYGGTAINNLLPKDEQFYDPAFDVPDYDFYSQTPQYDAMRLCDIFVKHGFANVEAKPGAHLLTFKVFVDFIGVADITYLDPNIFKKLWKEDIVRDGIHYVTPNFLRMSMYLELSRPRGDVSRWSKVYRRLMLLNKYYPIQCEIDEKPHPMLSDDARTRIETILKSGKVVLIGLRATELHTKSRSNKWELPIDVLADTASYEKFQDVFADVFSEKISIVEHSAYDELLPSHTDIIQKESGKILVRVFETQACHSYNSMANGIKVGSIPTLLQFFFGFVYADAHYLEGFDQNRIICIAQRLLDVSHRRFKTLTPIECLGTENTIRDIKAKTSKLRTDTPKTSPDFLRLFFTYRPGILSRTQKKSLKKKLVQTMKRLPASTSMLITDHDPSS